LGLKIRRNRHGHKPIVARPAGHSGSLPLIDLALSCTDMRFSIAVPQAEFLQTSSD
jgi:hypothetical protein